MLISTCVGWPRSVISTGSTRAARLARLTSRLNSRLVRRFMARSMYLRTFILADHLEEHRLGTVAPTRQCRPRWHSLLRQPGSAVADTIDETRREKRTPMAMDNPGVLDIARDVF